MFYLLGALGLLFIIPVCHYSYEKVTFKADSLYSVPRDLSVPDSSSIDSLVAASWHRGGSLPSHDSSIIDVSRPSDTLLDWRNIKPCFKPSIRSVRN